MLVIASFYTLWTPPDVFYAPPCIPSPLGIHGTPIAINQAGEGGAMWNCLQSTSLSLAQSQLQFVSWDCVGRGRPGDWRRSLLLPTSSLSGEDIEAIHTNWVHTHRVGHKIVAYHRHSSICIREIILIHILVFFCVNFPSPLINPGTGARSHLKSRFRLFKLSGKFSRNMPHTIHTYC